jgi:predicted RNase H-like nuclease (RuvC/YqgF family)
MSECTSCKFREGDCGHHYESVDGEVDLTIPAEHSCDRYGQCMFWKRSIESRRKEIRRLHNLIEKHINQINILEREIQREKDEERLKKAKDGMTVQVYTVDNFLYETKEGDTE